MEDVIRAHIHEMFVGYEILGCAAIRLTRDSDVLIDEDNAADLLTMIEEGVRGRRKGSVVRLQYDASLNKDALDMLIDQLDLTDMQLYPTEDFIAFSYLIQLYSAVDMPELKDLPFVPQPPLSLEANTADAFFGAIRAGDIMIHHPYESFDPVVKFMRLAADDPK